MPVCLFVCVCVTGVEALVGWLLDHPDVHITELSDADTVSDDYSDEEVLEELEEPEPAFPVVCSRTFCLVSPADLTVAQIHLLVSLISLLLEGSPS